MHNASGSMCGNLLDESVAVCARRAADAIRARGKDLAVSVVVSDNGNVRLASPDADVSPHFERVGTYLCGRDLPTRHAMAQRIEADLAESNAARPLTTSPGKA